ncbi:MAG TPA: hypothetical protein VD963_10655 [Phycisphaerales bacterium]|nr:hypothetical protein [Phycisphaerales bacterium]
MLDYATTRATESRGLAGFGPGRATACQDDGRFGSRVRSLRPGERHGFANSPVRAGRGTAAEVQAAQELLRSGRSERDDVVDRVARRMISDAGL